MEPCISLSKRGGHISFPLHFVLPASWCTVCLISLPKHCSKLPLIHCCSGNLICLFMVLLRKLEQQIWFPMPSEPRSWWYIERLLCGSVGFLCTSWISKSLSSVTAPEHQGCSSEMWGGCDIWLYRVWPWKPHWLLDIPQWVTRSQSVFFKAQWWIWHFELLLQRTANKLWTAENATCEA